MEKHKYRIVENKTANIMGNIGLSIFMGSLVIFGILLIISIFISRDLSLCGLAIFFLSLPISGIFIGIASIFSTKEKDTKLFLNEIRQELKQAKSIENLQSVDLKFREEAIDKHGMIRISFPLSVKEIFKEIKYKMDILQKINHQ